MYPTDLLSAFEIARSLRGRRSLLDGAVKFVREPGGGYRLEGATHLGALFEDVLLRGEACSAKLASADSNPGFTAVKE